MAQSVEYVADGYQTTFSYHFPAFELADLEVQVNGVAQSGNFVALGLGGGNGGAVKFEAAPTAGAVVRIARVKVPDQVTYLIKDENLADVADKAEARTNLGVYSKVEIEARDQAVKDAALLKAVNLADVADTAEARDNLGVYGTAEVYTKTEVEARDQAVKDAALLKAENLADVVDTAQARENLGVYSKAETLPMLVADTTIAVGAGKQFDTLSDALAFLDGYRVKPGVSVCIQIYGWVTEETGLIFAHPDGAQITIQGHEAPLTTAITGWEGVSGSSGNYLATVTVTDASSIAVGDWIAVRDVAGANGHKQLTGLHRVTAKSGNSVTIHHRCFGPYQAAGANSGSVVIFKNGVRGPNAGTLLTVRRSVFLCNLALVNTSGDAGANVLSAINDSVAIRADNCAFAAHVNSNAVHLYGAGVTMAGGPHYCAGQVAVSLGAQLHSTPLIAGSSSNSALFLTHGASAYVANAQISGTNSTGINGVYGAQIYAYRALIAYCGAGNSVNLAVTVSSFADAQEATCLTASDAWAVYASWSSQVHALGLAHPGSARAAYAGYGSIVRFQGASGDGICNPSVNTVGNILSYIDTTG